MSEPTELTEDLLGVITDRAGDADTEWEREASRAEVGRPRLPPLRLACQDAAASAEITTSERLREVLLGLSDVRSAGPCGLVSLAVLRPVRLPARPLRKEPCQGPSSQSDAVSDSGIASD